MKKRTKIIAATVLVMGLIISMIGGVCHPTLAKAKKIRISEKSLILSVGEKHKLKLKNVPKKQTKKIKWKSSKKKVATVSKKGVVTGKKEGKTKITATYKKKKYTCKVTVIVPPEVTDPVEKTKYELFTDDRDCECRFAPDYWEDPTPANYNNELAKFLLAASMLSESVIVPSDEEENQSDLQRFLDGNGFKDFQVNEDYMRTPTDDSVGVACAECLYNNDTKYFGVFFRSIGYGDEWASNMNIGYEGDHEGFKAAVEKAWEFIFSYINARRDVEDVKILITGQSRGAALANLTAGYLLDGKLYTGWFEPTENNIYSYCFATPQAVYKGEGVDSRDLQTGYSCIHNILFDRDIVCRIPPASFGFDMYGVKHTGMDCFPEKVEDCLQKLSQSCYDMFMSCKGKDYGGLTPGAWVDSYVKKFADLVVDRKNYMEQWYRPMTYLMLTMFSDPPQWELTAEEKTRMTQLGLLFATGLPYLIVDHYSEVEYAYLCGLFCFNG